jgi:hypothetical protein
VCYSHVHYPECLYVCSQSTVHCFDDVLRVFCVALLWWEKCCLSRWCVGELDDVHYCSMISNEIRYQGSCIHCILWSIAPVFSWECRVPDFSLLNFHYLTVVDDTVSTIGNVCKYVRWTLSTVSTIFYIESILHCTIVVGDVVSIPWCVGKLGDWKIGFRYCRDVYVVCRSVWLIFVKRGMTIIPTANPHNSVPHNFLKSGGKTWRTREFVWQKGQ